MRVATPSQRAFGLVPTPTDVLSRAPSLAGHRLSFAPPRPVVDRRVIDYKPGLFKNDVLPDCTAVSLANSAIAVAALNGYPLAVDEAKVPAFYAASLGIDDTDEAMAASDGAMVIDILTRQTQSGFDIGPQRLVGLFGVLPRKRVSIANAVDKLGYSYLGVLLRERDMESVGIWDAQPGRSDGLIVGGHATGAWDYMGLADTDTVRIATWGMLQPVTWRWIRERTIEAYGLFFRQLARSDGLDLGLNPDVLAADLRAMSEAA